MHDIGANKENVPPTTELDVGSNADVSNET